MTVLHTVLYFCWFFYASLAPLSYPLSKSSKFFCAIHMSSSGVIKEWNSGQRIAIKKLFSNLLASCERAYWSSCLKNLVLPHSGADAFDDVVFISD